MAAESRDDGTTCVVFAAGEYYDAASNPANRVVVPRGAFVVAADGGLDHARAAGVTPDVVVGDFDSLRGARPAPGAGTVALPPMKDDPDLLSALKIGWAHGCRTFHVYGALGGRIDHTLSAIQLTAMLARHGGIGFLHGDGTTVTAVCDGELRFAAHDAAPRRMVSVFPHGGPARGVDEPGLRYELMDGTLEADAVQGVSNEFRPGVPGAVSVREGTLVVTFPAEAPTPEVVRRHAFDGGIGELDTHVSPLLVR
ncbi:thiamine diphosphokinase [Bifidobacterium sp. CP2]|uniref:thiamine diphosphokinase n=1 Tax=Bifidobacterium TaxID=1678 RepID=UPI001BDC8CB2|nr:MULTISPECIES: thiamine diphosphokinase [Bifidobacterium]MBT1181138.1 thiamine diphosphokinase [Bifidobacterium sp. CP2]MBW3079810.1 thiamine diphosphokinase [Bifidobacterium saguinibicoloris]